VINLNRVIFDGGNPSNRFVSCVTDLIGLQSAWFFFNVFLQLHVLINILIWIITLQVKWIRLLIIIIIIIIITIIIIIIWMTKSSFMKNNIFENEYLPGLGFRVIYPSFMFYLDWWVDLWEGEWVELWGLERMCEVNYFKDVKCKM